MGKVFADTFYWVALANPGDSSYAAATAADAALTGVSIYTTDEVLVEFTTFYSADLWQRGRAATTFRRLLTNPKIPVIPQSRESFLAGLDLYQKIVEQCPKTFLFEVPVIGESLRDPFRGALVTGKDFMQPYGCASRRPMLTCNLEVV